MKLFTSWMTSKNTLVQANSKSEAAKILAKITANKERYCKESLLDATAQDIIKCAKIIKIANKINAVITIKLNKDGLFFIEASKNNKL